MEEDLVKKKEELQDKKEKLEKLSANLDVPAETLRIYDRNEQNEREKRKEAHRKEKEKKKAEQNLVGPCWTRLKEDLAKKEEEPQSTKEELQDKKEKLEELLRKIKKDKMGSVETDPKVIPYYTLDQARKHLLQREQSHKVQIKKKESLLDEETKSVNEKTEASPKAESDLQIQQMKAKNDLQIQKMKVDSEMEVSKTKDQLDEKLITKLLICGISLLYGHKLI